MSRPIGPSGPTGRVAVRVPESGAERHDPPKAAEPGVSRAQKVVPLYYTDWKALDRRERQVEASWPGAAERVGGMDNLPSVSQLHEFVVDSLKQLMEKGVVTLRAREFAFTIPAGKVVERGRDVRDFEEATMLEAKYVPEEVIGRSNILLLIDPAVNPITTGGKVVPKSVRVIDMPRSTEPASGVGSLGRTTWVQLDRSMPVRVQVDESCIRGVPLVLIVSSSKDSEWCFCAVHRAGTELGIARLDPPVGPTPSEMPVRA